MPFVFAAMVLSFKEHIVSLSGVSIFRISAIIGQKSVTLFKNVFILF